MTVSSVRPEPDRKALTFVAQSAGNKPDPTFVGYTPSRGAVPMWVSERGGAFDVYDCTSFGSALLLPVCIVQRLCSGTLH